MGKFATKRVWVSLVAAALFAAMLVPGLMGCTQRGDSVEPTGTPVTAETRIGLSTRLQVEWNGDWYEALVTRITHDDTFRVHYDGWDSRYEDVPRSRMRLAPVPEPVSQ